MIRSRVTFATIEAAATQAATRSPFQTARPGTPRPSTLKPSVSTYVGGDVEPEQRPAQRGQVGHVHAEPVALLRRHGDHRPGDGLAGDLVVQPLAGQRR